MGDINLNLLDVMDPLEKFMNTRDLLSIYMIKEPWALWIRTNNDPIRAKTKSPN